MMTMMTRQQKAYVSFLMDLSSVLVVVILMTAWIRDLSVLSSRNESAAGEKFPTQLSPSFLDEGFCLSTWTSSSWITKDTTHWTCSMFDFVGGAVMVAIAMLSKRKSTRKAILPMATYVLAHGYGHYSVSTKGDAAAEIDAAPTTQDMLTLAAILSIGPLRGMETVMESGLGLAKETHKSMYYGLVAAAVCFLVAIYQMGLQSKQQVTLLCINLSILFMTSLPRLLFLGVSKEKDLQTRVDHYPFFWEHVMASEAVKALVIGEPFFCDAILATRGGHFWFDVSLYASALSEIHNLIARDNEMVDATEKAKSA